MHHERCRRLLLQHHLAEPKGCKHGSGPLVHPAGKLCRVGPEHLSPMDGAEDGIEAPKHRVCRPGDCCRILRIQVGIHGLPDMGIVRGVRWLAAGKLKFHAGTCSIQQPKESALVLLDFSFQLPRQRKLHGILVVCRRHGDGHRVDAYILGSLNH